MKKTKERLFAALAAGTLAVALLMTPGTSFAAAPESKTTSKQAAGTTTDITYEQARDIALKDAGLDGKDVTWFETQKDKDSKTKTVTWELGFFLDDTEYDYEIDLSNGKILEKSSEKMSAEDKAENEQQALTLDSILKDNPDVAITADQALETALKDAGFDLSDVEVVKNNLDNDDGIIIYETEFISGSKKYAYEIDANSGEILDKDTESATDDD